MKFTDSQWKAIQICIQSIVTALLLLAQSLLASCVSADNGSIVNIDKDTDISVPITIPYPFIDMNGLPAENTYVYETE